MNKTQNQYKEVVVGVMKKLLSRKEIVSNNEPASETEH
jgi:hypothetical protein